MNDDGVDEAKCVSYEPDWVVSAFRNQDTLDMARGNLADPLCKYLLPAFSLHPAITRKKLIH